MKNLKPLLVAALAALSIGSVTTEAECFACKRVECSYDVQCAPRCSCVKLNGRIKGSCVQAW